MQNVGIISLYGLIFGIIGTSIGGVIGALLNIKSNKFLSFILEFAAGLMTAVICFDLIPETIDIVPITICILGIIIGVFAMILCDKIVNTCCQKKSSLTNNNMLKAGIIFQKV